jgi:alcohol dehydrogenase
MRALVSSNGGPAKVEECPEPDVVADGALVRVRRAGIDFSDVEVANGYRDYAGPLGNAFVGDVIAAAPGHEDWVGARVVGDINFGCGGPPCQRLGEPYCPHRFVLGIAALDCPHAGGHRYVGGAFAELVSLPIRNLHRLPSSITDRAALFCEPVAAAVQILEQVHVRPTSRVAVLGDGPLGYGIAQVMRWPGCEVTVVGESERRLALFNQLGFETRHARDEWPEKVQIVVESTGHPDGPGWAIRHVHPNGTVVLKSTIQDPSELDISSAVVDQITLVGSRSGPIPPVIRALADGRLEVESFVTDSFTLEEADEALRRASEPDAGKVEIVVSGADVD